MNYDKFVSEIEKFKIKPGMFNKNVYFSISGMIADGEKIIYALKGLDGAHNNADIPIVITDKCVYVAAIAGLFGSNVATIKLEKITSVYTGAGKMMGLLVNLVIAEGATTHALGLVGAPMAQEAIRIINQAQSELSSVTVASAAPVSQADELTKFKKLLDDGVLTQEEFDRKKAQILGL